MRFLMKLVAAALAALRGSWKLIDGTWKWVRDAVLPGSDPLPIEVSTCRTQDRPIEAVEVGLKRWAAQRLKSPDCRLPAGITPEAAGWAARLSMFELERMSKSSPNAIAAHIAGQFRLAGVRPLKTDKQDDAGHDKRLAALRARGAELRAALARTDERYREKSAALAM